MTKSKGQARITITHEDGSVTQTPWFSNLLNNLAIATTSPFATRMFLTDSAVPTKIDIAPTLLTQVGHVVTASGAFVFTAAHLGDTIKYSNGDTALIVEIVSATEVRTFEAYTRANQLVEIYRTEALGFDDAPIGPVHQSVDTTSSQFHNDLDKVSTFESSFSFPIFTGTPYTLRSIVVGDGNMFPTRKANEFRTARIVLPTPLDVLVNDVVRVDYSIELDFLPKTPELMDISDFLDGYPYVYTIVSATTLNNGGQEILTVEVDEDHHFEPGDRVTLSGVDALIDGVEMEVSENVDSTTYRCISPSAITGATSGTCHSRGEVEVRVDGVASSYPNNFFLLQPRSDMVLAHTEGNYIQDSEITADGRIDFRREDATLGGRAENSIEQPTLENGLTRSHTSSTTQFSPVRRVKQMIFPNHSQFVAQRSGNAMFLTFTDPQPIHQSATFTFSVGKRFRQDLS